MPIAFGIYLAFGKLFSLSPDDTFSLFIFHLSLLTEQCANKLTNRMNGEFMCVNYKILKKEQQFNLCLSKTKQKSENHIKCS